jgi:hypothetical protein
LIEFARDPRLLGAEIGFFSVLHTWNQKLEHHPHVHCVVPEGGLAPDRSRWVRPRYDFFLPVKALAKSFRGKFLDALRGASAAGQLRFPGQIKSLAQPRAFASLLQQSCRHRWVVYAKRPFGGPEHVLQYLGNYTHRIAISNLRLLSLHDGYVSFRWRDSAHQNKQRVMELRVEEFCRRYFLHVLPPGFVRIRHFGLFANRNRRASRELSRTMLGPGAPPPLTTSTETPRTITWSCPDCGGVMVIIERVSPFDHLRPTAALHRSIGMTLFQLNSQSHSLLGRRDSSASRMPPHAYEGASPGRRLPGEALSACDFRPAAPATPVSHRNPERKSHAHEIQSP